MAGYDRIKAVEYAHEWAYARNPKFYDFTDIGGDCTNFISQVLYEGSGIMNKTPVFGWYYESVNDRSPSWTGVDFLYSFLVKNKGTGPYASLCGINDIDIGDIIQISFSDSFSFKHSVVVVKTDFFKSPDKIYIAAHSYNRDYFPLSGYDYFKLRPLHIEGVRT